MEEEKKYLDFVIKYVNNKLNLELESFDELQFKYRRDPASYGIAYNIACETIKVLKNGQNKPYFARIDFEEENTKKIEKFYIGKYSINNNENLLVVDWRAPISNLYYDSEIGNTRYEAPAGIINGNLHLKRQFDIENGELKSFYDVDLVSNDALLQKYLNENNDARLKNIVSTIQKEQNNAIRYPLNKNLIVQGVAGSGKTTIALHRIAYLVYNYMNTIKNNQYLVIGPNEVFLKYIKSVLPDLDVSDINQSTYEMFSKEVIEDGDFKIKNSTKIQNKYISGKETNDIPKFKNSLKYKDMLDLFIESYLDEIVSSDLTINEYTILDKKQLKAILLTSLEDTKDFNKAIERFVLLGSKYIEDNNGVIISNFNKKSLEIFNLAKQEGKENECRKNINYVKNEINKNCKQSLRKYISKLKATPIKLYKKFVTDIEKYDLYNYLNLRELKKKTLENIKNNEFDFEDLAALLYIRGRIGISNTEKNYRHVVVDEAQDLGEFNYYVLKMCLPNATFSIFGDIAQSIYSYRSIDSWNEVMNIFDNCELLSFNKSYRTTDEIMTVANSISEILNIESAELSVRHGDDVLFSKINKENIPQIIKEKIEIYKEKGYKTIAVISKLPLQSNYINDDLSFEGLIIPNIDENTDITKDGNEIVTISNVLAKGLEFDAVIINNADEKIYDSTKTSDMKMLYVALTRALHKLDIIYTDKITSPLQKFIEKQKVKQKI